ncbi:hypothetical protein KCU88_g7078, partial [Aureobasidium melanogenum]
MAHNDPLHLAGMGSRPRSLDTHYSNVPSREATYTLAGPRSTAVDLPYIRSREPTSSMLEASHTRSRDQGTFVSQEYQDYNPKYAEPSNKPIWGLAAPLPRVKRPVIRPRHGTRKSKEQTKRPDSERQPTNQSVQPPAPAGTEAAPQIENTPSRNESEHEQLHEHPSRHAHRPAREQDLLRRATTARASTYQPEDVPPREPFQPEGAVSTGPSRQGQELEAQHISARDQDKAHLAPSHDRTQDERATGGAVLQRQTTGSTVQDFGQEHEPPVGQVTSEVEIDSARRRMQAIADTADNVSDLRYGTPNIDWEEYQKDELEPQHSQNEEPKDPDYFNWWGPIRQRFRQPLAEYLGTLVLMIIGLCGSIVHMTSEDDYGNLLSAYLSWGFGVMIGIYIAGGISGAHLNPALSILLSIFRGFPWSLCWQYIVAQMMGAITASGIVYGLYKDAIEDYAAADKSRAGPAFWTKPRDGLSNASAFFTEFAATGILAGSVLALGDDSNAPPGAGMHAFIIGLLITALCMAFSYNTGTCLNPARDFGPRLITWAAGFGTEVFTLHNWWWIWGPWLGTLSGGITGALIYDIFIFNGGESPINYPSGELRERIHSWNEIRMKSKMGRGKDAINAMNKEIEQIA